MSRIAVLIQIAAAFLFSTYNGALALVDMKSANYSESWTDLSFGDSNDSIRLDRAYNSRSINDGLFGFGWCSLYETNLRVVSSNRVVVTHCGAGQEDDYFLDDPDPKEERKQIEQAIILKVRERRPDLSNEYIEGLKKELAINNYMTEEFQRRMGLTSYPKIFSPYYSLDRVSTVVFDGKRFTLQARLGTHLFDMGGRLVEISYANGGRVKLDYYNTRQISKISDAAGHFISLVYDQNTGKVWTASSSSGATIQYFTTIDGNLISVTKASETTTYEYDSAHNLTRTSYPDSTWIGLTHNVDRDWVTGFRNRKGCVEEYKYETADKLHFWATVQKKCNDQITNNGRYEFFNKRSSRGVLYQSTVITQSNDVRTRVDWNERNQTIRRDDNGVIQQYAYDPLGNLVDHVIGNKEERRKYESLCRAPTTRDIGTIEEDGFHRERSIYLKYEMPSCRPRLVLSTDGSLLRFSYSQDDFRVNIYDAKGQLAWVEFDGDLWRLKTIGVDGIGSLPVSYNQVGDIILGDGDHSSQMFLKLKPIADLLQKMMPPY